MLVTCTRVHWVYYHHSDGSSSLKVLFDLGRVLVVVARRLEVELHVPLVDVVHVSLVVELPPATELGTLLYPVYTYMHESTKQTEL